jgi:hypothetical protein
MTVALARRGSGAGRQAMQLAGAAGILSLVLGGAGVLVGQMWAFPGTGATAGEIASFADAHRSALLVDMVLTTAAVWLWLIFGVGVWLRLREADEGEGFLPACFLAGLLSFVTLLFAGFAVFFVLVYRAPEASDPRLLYDLSFGLLAISGAPTALALGSYAISTLHTGCLPRCTAWLAVVAALAHVVLIASLLIPSGFFSLEGGVTIAIPATLFAWIVGTSSALIAGWSKCPPVGLSVGVAAATPTQL